MKKTNSEKVKEILERGVERILVKKHLEQQLKSKKKLRIKHGIDPTGKAMHLGRAIQLWKLRAFQELGHQIVLIIGDFTAQIGDASDKTSIRKPLSEKEVKENMKTYKKQFGKILDIKKVEIRYNSEWLKKLKLKDIISLSMNFTAQQMIQRRNFKQRWDKGKPIGIHELIYPILQGYDSVAVKADVEIGGYDQLFNLTVGREIQRLFKQPAQDIMVLKMLNGLDGRKMSTSRGNVINITDNSNQMYGKIMSMKDELIGHYFELCFQMPLMDIEKIKKELKLKRLNPRNAKAHLAKEIVKLYHGKNKAERAEKEFNRIFKQRKLPCQIPVFKTSKRVMLILDLISESGLSKSKSEAKRFILGGGVNKIIKDKETKINDWKERIKVEDNMILRIGKRRFVRIKRSV